MWTKPRFRERLWVTKATEFLRRLSLLRLCLPHSAATGTSCALTDLLQHLPIDSLSISFLPIGYLLTGFLPTALIDWFPIDWFPTDRLLADQLPTDTDLSIAVSERHLFPKSSYPAGISDAD